MPGPAPKDAYDRVMARTRVGDHLHAGSHCVECTLATAGDGYPVVGVGSTADGTKKQVTAAAVVYEHKYGPLPDGMIVCRDCFNPRCVNILHLSAGTHASKRKSCDAAGRHNKGAAVIPESDIALIRRRLARGERVKDIAADYGVRHTAISNLKQGRSWRRVS